jgi:choline-glycine betaine transporter
MFALVAPIAHVGLLVACVILAATSGVYVLQSLARGNERFTRHLTPWQRQLAWACTIVGLALTALSVLGANFAHVLFG